MAVDEMDDAVVGAAEAEGRQDRVGVGDEIAIGEEQELDEGDFRALVRRKRLLDERLGRSPSNASRAASPGLKFTSAMLTYFGSFVTPASVATK